MSSGNVFYPVHGIIIEGSGIPTTEVYMVLQRTYEGGEEVIDSAASTPIKGSASLTTQRRMELNGEALATKLWEHLSSREEGIIDRLAIRYDLPADLFMVRMTGLDDIEVRGLYDLTELTEVEQISFKGELANLAIVDEPSADS